MIETKLALALALQAVTGQLPVHQVTDIVVEPTAEAYAVHLTRYAPAGDAQTEVVVVMINLDDGSVVATHSEQAANPVAAAPSLRSLSIISGPRAHEAALAAIKGYEHYDPVGPLEIHLEDGYYSVIFPEQDAGGDAVRGVDYAFDIWIDAVSGAVRKVLVPS